MRTKNSIKNIVTALVGQVVGIIITFIARIIFINILGNEYLGINGLFTNILSMISLAEMGFGTAIIYKLYKPLAEKDFTKVKALMNFYAFAYRIIGIIVLCIGLILIPFLKYIIKDNYNFSNLNFIYLLYLTGSVSTYFFAYKRSLIIADQKNYIAVIYRYSFFILINILQIAVLLLLKNFILYLIIQIVFTFVENITISFKIDKMYPFLKDSKGIKLDNVSKNEIFRNVRALAYHRLGGVVVNGTSNILISAFISIQLVGIYSNYYLVTNALNIIIGQVFTSITASVGNLNALENKEKSLNVYKTIFFANFWIIGICSISLLILLNPFITIWIGKQYLLNNSVVLLIVINFYISGMRKTSVVFKDSMGLFWNDRYKPIFESIINLVTSIILVKQYGIAGILGGTIISTLLTSFWVEPYIVYKHGFKTKVIQYFLKYIHYSIVVLFSSIIILFLNSLISDSIYGFILKIVICIVIPNLFFYILFHKTFQIKYFLSLLNNIIIKVLNKNSTIK